MITFIENKYKIWYFRIITAAQSRTDPSGYTESHHIIPRSLGGDNSSDNIVRLTAREHFICHLLLAKCIDGKDRYKMYAAVAYFSNNQNRNLKLTSRRIAAMREYNALASSERNKGNQYWKCRKPITDDLREQLGSAARGKTWVNNGSVEMLVIDSTEYLKNGFLPGRLATHISKSFNGGHLKGKTLSVETKQKMSKPKHEGHGQKVSESRKKMFKEMGGMSKTPCPHCGKLCSKTNLIRWHNENCKLKKQISSMQLLQTISNDPETPCTDPPA